MDRAAEDLYFKGLEVATNPKYSKWVVPILLTVEAVLCALIIRTVQYTEIDWKNYMQQAQLYISGEKDYALIKGDNGPVTYPALHLYLYRILYTLTNRGTNIVLAQVFFAFLYVVNLGLAMLCYMEANVPPYVYPMLVLSKRLHSIYVLRCFNEGFVMTFLFLAILMYQKKEWTAGTLAFACGLSVDANLLCVLPAVIVILVQARGPWYAAIQTSTILQIHLVLAVPFLQGNPRAYLEQVFGSLRKVNFVGIVNWRFVREERLLSKEFAVGLLTLQVTLIILFLCTRWLQPTSRSFPKSLQEVFHTPTEKELERRTTDITPGFILVTTLTAIAVSMLCARSLHYQSFAWIAWATPFLLWRTKLNPALQYLIWSGQELAWDQVPPNDLSSQIIVGALAVVVVQVWTATDLDDEDRKKKVEQQAQAKVKASAPQRSKKLEQEATKILNDPDWPM